MTGFLSFRSPRFLCPPFNWLPLITPPFLAPQPPFDQHEYVVEYSHDHSCHPHHDQLRNFFRLVNVPWPFDDDTCPAYFRPARTKVSPAPAPVPLKAGVKAIHPEELDISNAVSEPAVYQAPVLALGFFFHSPPADVPRPPNLHTNSNTHITGTHSLPVVHWHLPGQVG